MADFAIYDGDQVIFLPAFSPALVNVKPGKISGSGASSFAGKPVCVEGDEVKVNVGGCAYMTPAYPTPGTGNLKIAQLASDQLTKETWSGDKKIILKGSKFTARFEVASPASHPKDGPDPVGQYQGRGFFITRNQTYRVS